MKPFEQQNFYELLEVPVSASQEELNAAYERALEFYSPDSVAVYALVDPDQVESLRKRLAEAMASLSDPALRTEYDRSIGVASSWVNSAAPSAADRLSQVAKTAAEPAAVAAPAAETRAEAAKAAPEPVAAAAPVAETPAEAPRPEPVKAPESPANPEAPSPAFPSFAVTYVPRSAGSLNSVAFFTSYSIPARPLAPSPAESGEPPKTERAEAPASAAARPAESASSPAPSVEPARAAEPVPDATAAAVPVRPAEPASAPAAAVESPPATEPVSEASAPRQAPAEPPRVDAPVAKPAGEGQATSPAKQPAPVLAADAVEAGSDEVTPARLLAHKRPGSPGRPGASSARSVPPPLPPRGARMAHRAPSPAPAPAASEPARTPEAVPARPASSPPAETGLVPAPRPASPSRETPRTPKVDISADAEFTGELLRRVRESRGHTLHQLAERTRISRQHLENVEADHYEDLPAPVYLRGILMNLARELGLDPLRVSRSYLHLASKGRR